MIWCELVQQVDLFRIDLVAEGHPLSGNVTWLAKKIPNNLHGHHHLQLYLGVKVETSALVGY